jgi:hypothetical protein
MSPLLALPNFFYLSKEVTDAERDTSAPVILGTDPPSEWLKII